MSEYHKINSVFKRDPATKKFLPEYSTPEIDFLRDAEWTWEEKVDGTNVRVIYSHGGGVEFRGRTDRAVMVKPLLEFLQLKLPAEKLAEKFKDEKDEPLDSVLYGNYVTLYGEGIGPKIQAVGSRYRKSTYDFVLFDVRVGKWWLTRESVWEIGGNLDVLVAPQVGGGILAEAEQFVRAGFKSEVAEDEDLEAEGLILRPKVELLARSGQRIITKLKGVDFRP